MDTNTPATPTTQAAPPGAATFVDDGTLYYPGRNIQRRDPAAIQSAGEKRFYANEDDLFLGLTRTDIDEIEAELRQTRLGLAFFMQPPRDLPDETSPHPTIMEVWQEILTACQQRWGITFPAGLRLTTGTSDRGLVGTPHPVDINVWGAVKRGYLALQHIDVAMSFDFAGRPKDNYSANQLEYQCSFTVTPALLLRYIRGLGARDAVVMSHARNGPNHSRWPAIGCINSPKHARTSGHHFRLAFPGVATAQRVYAQYRQMHADLGRTLSSQDRHTRLMPLHEFLWHRLSGQLFHPDSREGPTYLNTMLRLAPISTANTATEIQTLLRLNAALEEDVHVDIEGTVAWLTFTQTSAAAHVYHMYGPRGQPLWNGNQRFFVYHAVGTMRAPLDLSRIACHDCGQLGHMAADCPISETADDQWTPVATLTRRAHDAATLRPQHAGTAAAMAATQALVARTVQQEITSQLAHQAVAAEHRLQATFAAQLQQQQAYFTDIITRQAAAITVLQHRTATHEDRIDITEATVAEQTELIHDADARTTQLETQVAEQQRTITMDMTALRQEQSNTLTMLRAIANSMADQQAAVERMAAASNNAASAHAPPAASETSDF
ncbi:hypothetical protein DYB36_006054 [Aphanomyces astaci]|uniref:CCHC-type domain-containing protein n=1 Tax=Aphanomyces astaci TaxID=112090 RepID=A0A397AQT8_APHAT|nr:hypothetical protein DYB36_006054 [Aphanomyces astaci]